MSNRLDTTFARCKAEGKTAFIAFITAGDPQPSVTVDTMHALVRGGADVIELGVPFSDPSADGPTIQKSNERALAHKVNVADVLAMVTAFRSEDKDTPVVLMGYVNPIVHMGYKAFVEACAQATVDGLITVDLPPEESQEFDALLAAQQIYPIYLLAPTTTDARMAQIVAASKGFVYYVSVKGVTGNKEPDYREVGTQIQKIKQTTDLPIGVGFGIKDAASVQAIGEQADAVVVGSAIVQVMQSVVPDKIPAAVEAFVAKLTREHI